MTEERYAHLITYRQSGADPRTVLVIASSYAQAVAAFCKKGRCDVPDAEQGIISIHRHHTEPVVEA